MLSINYLEAHPVTAAIPHSYSVPPPIFSLEITDDTVMEVVHNFFGGGIPGGSDVVSL